MQMTEVCLHVADGMFKQCLKTYLRKVSRYYLDEVMGCIYLIVVIWNEISMFDNVVYY